MTVAGQIYYAQAIETQAACKMIFGSLENRIVRGVGSTRVQGKQTSSGVIRPSMLDHSTHEFDLIDRHCTAVQLNFSNKSTHGEQ